MTSWSHVAAGALTLRPGSGPSSFTAQLAFRPCFTAPAQNSDPVALTHPGPEEAPTAAQAARRPARRLSGAAGWVLRSARLRLPPRADPRKQHRGPLRYWGAVFTCLTLCGPRGAWFVRSHVPRSPHRTSHGTGAPKERSSLDKGTEGLTDDLVRGSHLGSWVRGPTG